VALPNSGFNANLQPKDSAPPPASPSQNFSRSFSVEGIRTFNGDGTGTVKGTAVGIVVKPTPGPNGFPHFPPSARSGEFRFSFPSTVAGEAGCTTTMPPATNSKPSLPAPPAGKPATVDAIPPIVGMMSQDGKTLIAAHVTPTVETRSYSNGDVDPEICHRSR